MITIVTDSILTQSFEENFPNNNAKKAKPFPDVIYLSSTKSLFNRYQKTLEEYKKSVRFSDSLISDSAIAKPGNDHPSNSNYTGSAWLNSENTKAILTKIVSKETSSSQVAKSLLARPQLHTDPNQRLPDPIFSLLIDNCSYETTTDMRKIPAIDDSNASEKDVLLLLEDGWIRPAIDLTSRILNKLGFTYAKSSPIDSTSTQLTIDSGRLWCLRLVLLARMKLVSVLESELSGFLSLDAPNLCREFYSSDPSPSPPARGSLVPFSMRLLHAELPLFGNKFGEALNRLYYLLAVIKRIIVNLDSGYSEDGTNVCSDQVVKGNAVRIWQKRRSRVLVSCMRVLVASKDYPSVIDVIHTLVDRAHSDVVPAYSKDALFHLMGRVYLQLGDIDNAEFFFEQSLRVMGDRADPGGFGAAGDDVVKARILVQNALICISRNCYDDAKRCLQQCLEITPHSSLVRLCPWLGSDWLLVGAIVWALIG